jgi:enoyl-CoA hydratase/carnithine racemase
LSNDASQLPVRVGDEGMPVESKPSYDSSLMPCDLHNVQYRKDGHVAYVTIDRPQVRNALHSAAYKELRSCWRDIGLDPEIYVAIVTGTGTAFCAGRDVKFLADHQDAGVRTPHENPSSPSYQWGGGGLPEDVELEKPLICAINGLAVGVGLSLVLQTQLRVMADDAWLGDQHTNVGRLGLPHRLYAGLPPAVAAYLTLCNGRLTAEECLRLGVVNRVVARDEVMNSAEELAAMVCRSSPRAVQAAVRLYRLAGASSEPLASYARHLDQEIAESEDAREGPAAFREKRAPVWKTR